MKLYAVCQARMGSDRLPGKVLAPIAGKPALAYLLERLERARTVDGVVVATSSAPEDDDLARFCEDAGIALHRGPLADVAGRFVEVIDRFGLDAFVRVNGDSPLFDQVLMDLGVERFRAGEWDVVTNVFPRSFPTGQSFEVIRADTYRAVYAELTDPADREHVTPFLYRHAERFRIDNLESGSEGPRISLSLDTPEDQRTISAIVERMDRPHWTYTSAELIELHRQVIESDRPPSAQ